MNPGERRREPVQRCGPAPLLDAYERGLLSCAFRRSGSARRVALRLALRRLGRRQEAWRRCAGRAPSS